MPALPRLSGGSLLLPGVASDIFSLAGGADTYGS